MSSDLVQIGKKAAEGKVTRRRFIQGLSAASGAAALSGCADSNKQQVYPYVVGEDKGVPGVALWYRSACTECSASCGITVRTREGRAVKIEGNPEHTVNKGTLCALGQSSLQALYDPDRIRQPLAAPSAGAASWSDFSPKGWQEALSAVAKELKASAGKKYFITGELSGSNYEIVREFCEKLNITHITYDVTQPVALARATEDVFGEYGIPHYDLESADLVMNFGADFLETWVSPAEYSRAWAQSRRKKIPTRYVHLEPRFSQTAASADKFLAIHPGSERVLLHYLVASVASESSQLTETEKNNLFKLTEQNSLEVVSKHTGLSVEKIALLTSELKEAKAPLILAGGASTNSVESQQVFHAAHLLNTLLGAVGPRVWLGNMRKPKTSLAELSDAIDAMNAGEVDAVIVDSSNPVFSLPSDYGLSYAMKKVKKIRLSLTSFKDETATSCSHILPSSHTLESWGDVESLAGVRTIIQPVMRPVFDTRSLGDILIAIAKSVGNAFEAEDFRSFIKFRWNALHKELGSDKEFERWFLECVERGGVFTPSTRRGELQTFASLGDLSRLSFSHVSWDDAKEDSAKLVYLPFASFKLLDGRGANRGWLQELPDPITKIVWDSWAEIHPETAEHLGIKHGDLVAIKNFYGEVKVPAHVTPYMSKKVIAVPLGQGHSEYGRFASQVRRSSGAALKGREAGDFGPMREFRTRIDNAYDLLPRVNDASRESLVFLSTKVAVQRLSAKSYVTLTQKHDSQEKRPIVQLDSIDKNGKVVKVDYHEHEYPEAKDMYDQRKHPLYRWGMTIDLAACTGCSACVVACYAENNIPVVGKKVVAQERHMGWLRIDRYFDGPEEQPLTGFQPMMCQHCQNAPCEPVCPVYATYHNDEGLNMMVYNRCVGTRYCGNNCSYKVRRFNWFDFEFPSPLDWQLNPDVTKRTAGVMEKCTFCVQRINEVKDRAKDLGRLVVDGEVQPACAQTCPTQAITFGNLKDSESQVAQLADSPRAYKVLDYHLNTKPSVSYLRNRKYKV